LLEAKAIMTEASVQWTDQERFIAISSSRHSIVLDAAAQEKTANSPMELVLIALCACTASDVVNILRKKREPLTSLEVHARAERATGAPSVYTEIHLLYRVGGNITGKAIEDAVRLSEEKYCSVAAMLNKTAKISYSIESSPNNRAAERSGACGMRR
jgi:putative redox protein